MQDIVTKYINDRPPLYKEATNVVRIVAFMSEQLNRKADDFRDCVKDTLSWLVSLIKDRAIEDTGLARELFHLYINMSADVDDFNAIQDIALDIPKVLGDLEITESQEDTEVSLTHAMLNQKTCNTITVLLFAFLDESVDELNWCVSRLKQKGKANTKKKKSLRESFTIAHTSGQMQTEKKMRRNGWQHLRATCGSACCRV